MSSDVANPTASPKRVTAGAVITLITGLWLLFAPNLLDFQSTAARYNAVTVGVLLLTTASIQMSLKATTRVFSGCTLVLGVWMIVAPFLLGYEQATERVHDILVGLTLAACATVSLRSRLRVREAGGA